LYISGFFVDTVDFDPGAGTYPLGADLGGSDIFILRTTNSASQQQNHYADLFFHG